MKLKSIISILLLSIVFYSCEDNLDTKTTFEWEDEHVWRIPEFAEGVLMNAYNAISARPDNFGNNFLDCATDNAITNSYGAGVFKAAMGGITASDNPLGNWGNCYTQLQHINIFLEKGLTNDVLYNRADSTSNAQIKQRLKGEAHFLRAFWHTELLKIYGGKGANGIALGVPLAKKYYSQQEATNFEDFKRATYVETVNFIVADLDSALKYLPESYTGSSDIVGTTQFGRANKVAARLLKARVYLFAASPANQDDSVTKIDGMGVFSVLNETEYNRKWVLSALKMDTIIRSSGFGAFTGITATLFADAATTTPTEIVFRKYFNSNAVETQHFPPFYYGNANTTPSQNLVKAFSTKTGYPQNDSRSGWSAANPYANLDNRFLLSIYYHGATFGTTGGKLNMLHGGKDSPEFDLKATRSGFYLAKFISKKDKMLNPVLKASAVHYNPILRKAEVFLSFAEASNEAWGPKVKGPGCLYSAYDIIKDVRLKSGGITDLTYLDEMASSKDKFRKLILNERRLEFAFENQRYFDLRRCLLALNEDIYGVEITLDQNNLPVYTEKVIEPRKYEVKHYFSPLPYNEIQKNKYLINNQGW